MKKKKTGGEARLIEHIEKTFRFPSDRRLLLGPGDDCAVLRHGAGRDLVITTDEMVEGTHYLARFATPEDIARKLMRINLSDLASMGDVQPVSCVVGSGLRKDIPPDFTRRFMKALKAEALRYGISIAGGNLAGARENHFYMTVWGEAGTTPMVTRYGARPGDLLFNVGPLGQAAAGLELLMKGGAAPKKFPGLIKAFWRPEPQLAAGALLGGRRLATAMLDNSDGLARSAAIISELSGCRVIVSVGEGACAPELRACSASAGRPWRHYAVNGGEDYGLVFTAPEKNLGAIKKLLPAAYVVGRVEKGAGAVIENFNGKVKSFEHF
ncbi:MAG: thiamine-phosphate kinase [Elusimicrobia bacterium GWA2_64_40]|nr:MAG: thiamine-phosphate kinase [Elusimicrobia bacterium GWA2_64_40]OGR64512.1 MAG: thiamine-phosphate kinase [Elusimicrobia bacterium GWB2_63_16]